MDVIDTFLIIANLLKNVGKRIHPDHYLKTLTFKNTIAEMNRMPKTIHPVLQDSGAIAQTFRARMNVMKRIKTTTAMIISFLSSFSINYAIILNFIIFSEAKIEELKSADGIALGSS